MKILRNFGGDRFREEIAEKIVGATIKRPIDRVRYPSTKNRTKTTTEKAVEIIGRQKTNGLQRCHFPCCSRNYIPSECAVEI